jgi:Spy/CpxP family protein refolding chaperone
MKLLPLLSLFGVAVLSAQQTAAPPARHFGRGPGGDPDQMFEQRLTSRLGLTAEQQNLVHTALAERAVIGKGTTQQLRTLHNSLVTAIKAGNGDQIDQISTQLETARQQDTALRAKTISKIYGSLSPAQQAKAGPNLELLMGRPGFGGPGPGRHRGLPPGANGAAPATGGSSTAPGSAAPQAAQ